MYTRRDTGCIGHNREKLLRNNCLLMVLKLFFFLVIRGNDIQVYHSDLSHFGCVSPRIPKAFYRISLLCALCESYMRSFPNTLPQTRKTILLLLLMCGDNAAATNPGPNSLLIQNPCTFYNNTFRYMTRIWDTWDINREDNKERDKELYREFRRKVTINGNEREKEIRMKEEEFIEQNLEWKEEKEGKKEKNTYIRKKNERKNQILENWRRIREKENSKDRYRSGEDGWRGIGKRVRISDGEITKKKDNTIMNNRYRVLEDMEEEEEKERRDYEMNKKSFCEEKLRNVRKIIKSNMRTVDIIREIRKSKSQITKKIMEIKYVNEIEKREMEMILNDLNATSREISKHERMIMERYNEEIKEKENEEENERY